GSDRAVVGPTLSAVGPIGLPRLREVALDGVVVTFAAGLAVVTGLGFGLWPARHIGHVDVASHVGPLLCFVRSMASPTVAALRSAQSTRPPLPKWSNTEDAFYRASGPPERRARRGDLTVVRDGHFALTK